MKVHKLLSLLGYENPEHVLVMLGEAEVKAKLLEILSVLEALSFPHEARAVKEYFNLEGNGPKSLDKIAKGFERPVTRLRVTQRICKGLGMMRCDPQRLILLSAYEDSCGNRDSPEIRALLGKINRITKELERMNKVNGICKNLPPEAYPKHPRSVCALGLSRQALEILRYAEIYSIDDLVLRNEEEILSLDRMGLKRLAEIKKALASRGLFLRA